MIKILAKLQIGKFIHLYRVPFVESVSKEGILVYGLKPDLRAKILGIRIPIILALDLIGIYRFSIGKSLWTTK